MKDNKPRFPSPFEVETPPGCEGWEKMYPDYLLISEERREIEEEKFWFRDALHHPEPKTPFDTFGFEACNNSLGQYNTRTFMIPPASGWDSRIINGYLYQCANGITDPAEIQERAAYFTKRAGYYYANWDEVSENWLKKVEALLKETEEIEFKDLPNMEDESMVFEKRGLSSGYFLLENYSKLVMLAEKAWNFHFEPLNIMYGAYLTFLDFCKRAFPGIADQTVSKMVSGIDVTLFRPDEELKKLAHLAVDLNVAGHFKQTRKFDEIILELERTSEGKKWLDELEKVKYPWFNMNTAPHPGFYHQYKSWMRDMTVPFRAIAGYVGRLEKGETIRRPLQELREEKDRIAKEYYGLLKTDEDKANFKELLELSKKVFPIAENHLFYIDNWFMSVFYEKIENLGKVFVKRSFFEKPDDIFYLHRFEINYALYDLYSSWCVDAPAKGPKSWPGEIRKRREIIENFRRWSPPPALGKPPKEIKDPIVVTLYGITSETLDRWSASKVKPEEVTELAGLAGSPGVTDGIARVLLSPTELSEVETGEILVCPATSPSWAPVFGEIRAVVTDAGGLMSHGAIVSREYGLPAVVGVTGGTSAIKTGDRIRVDGDNGLVTILERAS